MAGNRFQLPEAKPLDPTAVYDGIVIEEVLLRFPEGIPSGGHIGIRRLRAGQPVGELVMIALEPGRPDEIEGAVLAFCEAQLKASQALEASARVAAPPKPTPAPEPLPMGRL